MAQVIPSQQDQVVQEVSNILAELLTKCQELSNALATIECENAKSCEVCQCAKEVIKCVKRLIQLQKRIRR